MWISRTSSPPRGLPWRARRSCDTAASAASAAKRPKKGMMRTSVGCAERTRGRTSSEFILNLILLAQLLNLILLRPLLNGLSNVAFDIHGQVVLKHQSRILSSSAMREEDHNDKVVMFQGAEILLQGHVQLRTRGIQYSPRDRESRLGAVGQLQYG